MCLPHGIADIVNDMHTPGAEKQLLSHKDNSGTVNNKQKVMNTSICKGKHALKRLNGYYLIWGRI